MIVFRKKITPDTEIDLEPEESSHIKARRIKQGEEIIVSNGLDSYTCATLLSSRQIVTGQIFKLKPGDIDRTIVTAVPEPKRWDWLLQKATELGVTEIHPLTWDRSQIRKINKPRSMRIIQEACNQSQRLKLPNLSDQSNLADMLILSRAANKKTISKMILLDPEAKKNIYDVCNPDVISVTFLIGPEGGIEDSEKELIRAAGVVEARMGRQILRIETAAIAALAATLY